jgi:hypothetical protein
MEVASSRMVRDEIGDDMGYFYLPFDALDADRLIPVSVLFHELFDHARVLFLNCRMVGVISHIATASCIEESF